MRILILARATDVELSMPHKSNRIITTRTTGGPRDAKAGVLSATYGFEELDKYAEIHTYFEGSRLAPTLTLQSAASRQTTEICEDDVLFLLHEP
jgi:hypothetical protein